MRELLPDNIALHERLEALPSLYLYFRIYYFLNTITIIIYYNIFVTFLASLSVTDFFHKSHNYDEHVIRCTMRCEIWAQPAELPL